MTVSSGDAVEVAGKGHGVVRFVGETQFAPGITWIGVELAAANGKNNGSVQGVKYFECAENCGCFVREDVVKKVEIAQELKEKEVKRDDLEKMMKGNEAVKVVESEAGEKRGNDLEGKDVEVKNAAAQDAEKEDEAKVEVVKEERVEVNAAKEVVEDGEVRTPVKSRKEVSESLSSVEDVVTGDEEDVAEEVDDDGGESLTRTPARSSAASRAAQGSIAKLREKKQALQQRIRSSAAKTAAMNREVNSAPIPMVQVPPSPNSVAEVSPTLNSLSPSSSGGDMVVGVEAFGSMHDRSKEIEELKARIAALDDMRRADGEALQSQTQLYDKQVAELNKELDEEKTKRGELEAELRKAKSALERTEMDQEAKAKGTMVTLERTVEKQAKELEELNGVVESLTLDKEIMEEEKDIAEEKILELELQIEQLKSDFEEEKQVLMQRTPIVQVSAGEGSVDESLAEKLRQAVAENEKLREALKRLHTTSTAEKADFTKQIKSLTKEKEAMAQTASLAETFRTAKQTLEAQVEELKGMLDTAQAYEKMVEDLSEKNLELADENAELKEANEELEELRLLSEEVEQQHSDLQKDMQQELSSKESQLLEANATVEKLSSDLRAIEAVVEKLRERVWESQTREVELEGKLEEQEHLRSLLSESKDQARSANLALLSESEARVARLVQVEQARTEKRQNEYRAMCVEALVPDSVMDKTSREMLGLLLSSIHVCDASRLISRILLQEAVGPSGEKWLTEKAPLVCADLLGGVLTTLSDMQRFWMILQSGVTLKQLEEWGPLFSTPISQSKHGLGQVLQMLTKDGSGLVNIDESLTKALIEVLRSASAGFGTASDKAQADLGKQYMGSSALSELRRLHLSLLRSEDPSASSVGLLCAQVERAEKDSIFPLALSEPVQLSLVERRKEVESGSSGSFESLKSLLVSIQQEVKAAAPLDQNVPLCLAWKERADEVANVLESAAESKKELEQVKSALKRRVMQVHSKVSEISSMQLLKEDLEQKLDAAREIAKGQLDLGSRVKELEQQLALKDTEFQQAIIVAKETTSRYEDQVAVLQEQLLSQQSIPSPAEKKSSTPDRKSLNPLAAARAAAAAAAAVPSPVASAAGGDSPRSFPGTPQHQMESDSNSGDAQDGKTSAALVRNLLDEVSFWKSRTIVQRLASLDKLEFTPAAPYKGRMVPSTRSTFAEGEDRLGLRSAKESMEKMLLLQSSIRVPSVRKSPEVSLHQQLLGQRLQASSMCKKMDLQREQRVPMVKVGSVQIGGGSSSFEKDQLKDSRAIVLPRSTLTTLFKPLPIVDL